MSHLKTITDAYKQCGIDFIVRDKTTASGVYSYLFFAGSRREELETGDLSHLCIQYPFIEFFEEEVVSY